MEMATKKEMRGKSGNSWSFNLFYILKLSLGMPYYQEGHDFY